MPLEVGSLLSGGIDSSTVSGMFSSISEQAVRSYSIGFDAEGYDEIEYAKIAAKRFREDLYHRLSVIVIKVPPLIQRVDDIPLLVDKFLASNPVIAGVAQGSFGLL